MKKVKDLAKKICEILEINCDIISPNYELNNSSDLYIGDASKMLSLFKKYKINLIDLKQIIIDTDFYLNNNQQ